MDQVEQMAFVTLEATKFISFEGINFFHSN